MNIFRHELRAYRKFLIIWTASLTALMAIYFSMYTAVAEDFESFRTLMEGYPIEVRNALGIQIEYFSTLLGFYSFALTMIILFGAIQAMILGVSIVSKEVREKTADFLMTKPISRSDILSQKLLSGLAVLLLTNGVYLIFTHVMANAVSVDKVDLGTLYLMSFTLLFVQLMFYSFGILISILLRKVKSVLTISLGVVFAFFAIAAFGATAKDEPMRYLTPFKYFDPSYVMLNEQYELSFLITAIILIIISIGVSYYVYNKKDIHSV